MERLPQYPFAKFAKGCIALSIAEGLRVHEFRIRAGSNNGLTLPRRKIFCLTLAYGILDRTFFRLLFCLAEATQEQVTNSWLLRLAIIQPKKGSVKNRYKNFFCSERTVSFFAFGEPQQSKNKFFTQLTRYRLYILPLFDRPYI